MINKIKEYFYTQKIIKFFKNTNIILNIENYSEFDLNEVHSKLLKIELILSSILKWKNLEELGKYMSPFYLIANNNYITSDLLFNLPKLISFYENKNSSQKGFLLIYKIFFFYSNIIDAHLIYKSYKSYYYTLRNFKEIFSTYPFKEFKIEPKFNKLNNEDLNYKEFSSENMELQYLKELIYRKKFLENQLYIPNEKNKSDNIAIIFAINNDYIFINTIQNNLDKINLNDGTLNFFCQLLNKLNNENSILKEHLNKIFIKFLLEQKENIDTNIKNFCYRNLDEETIININLCNHNVIELMDLKGKLINGFNNFIIKI